MSSTRCVEYAVNSHLSLRLNVYNLTDNTYIRSINNNGGRYNPGQPRPAWSRRTSGSEAIRCCSRSRTCSTRNRWRRRGGCSSSRLGRRPRHRRPPVGADEGQPADSARTIRSARAARRHDPRRAAAQPAVHFGRAPLRVFPPLFNCYAGRALVRQSRGQRDPTGDRHGGLASAPICRATLFLADPEEYDGGELLIEDTYGVHSIKLPAGHMVALSRDEPSQRSTGHARRAHRIVLLDPEHGPR